MAVKVLDSWALLAFFEDEPAADVVAKMLEQAAEEKHRLLMCVVNWGEIYYNTMRRVSQEAAELKAREIALLPVEIVGVGDDLALARQAAV
ncbi:PIN domain-containing protein, partial [Candidatus Sumerlaeota bacterium]|nr:PIN domain-containing protein [Candidatus Sumerlaeota bacterium]